MPNIQPTAQKVITNAQLMYASLLVGAISQPRTPMKKSNGEAIATAIFHEGW
jgi:hypothetical protein